MYEKRKFLNISLIIVGITLTVYGTITYFFLNDILGFYNKKLLTISPSMKFFEDWKDTPNPIINRIYLFNFTNPDDFERNGSKPVMKELGPYVYKEYQKKVNLTWNSNGTVTYRVHRVWYFNPESSNGTANDNFTSFNILAGVLAYQGRNGGYFKRKALSMVLSAVGEKLSKTTTADIFLFRGYNYSLSAVTSYFEPLMKRIGLFHEFNDTSVRDGILNVNSGEYDSKEVAKVKYWNYSPYQPHGDLITGTNGELYPSELSKTRITLFTPWLCQDIHFDYDSEEWVDGIKGYKFLLSERNFDNGSKYEENLNNWPEERFPYGIVNISSCYYNSMAVGSLPHFFTADPYYTDKVEGMKPDIKKHQSYIIIEPMSGVLLKARCCAQVNFLIRRYKYIRLYKDIPRVTIYPLMWLEKSIDLPKSITNFLRSYLLFVRVLEISALPCLVIGICILSIVAVWNNTIKFEIQNCYRCQFLQRRRKESRLAEHSPGKCPKDNYYFSKLPQKSRVKGTNYQNNIQGPTKTSDNRRLCI